MRVVRAYDPGGMFGSKTHSSLEALRGVPLFAGLDRSDLDAITRISTEEEFRAGEELIRENEAGRQFFVLLDGEAEVLRNGVEINRLVPGEFFGEIRRTRAGRR